MSKDKKKKPSKDVKLTGQAGKAQRTIRDRKSRIDAALEKMGA
jgi:hypothetical protein